MLDHWESDHGATFAEVESTVRRWGKGKVLCSDNPSCASPPYWRRLEDTPEDRRLLADRVRQLCAQDDPALHGDLGMRRAKAFALKELTDVG